MHGRTGTRRWRICSACSTRSAACCCSRTCRPSMRMARPRSFLSTGASATRSAGAPATRALFAPERITARAAQADELQVAERVLAALPFGVLTYARVDLIRDTSHAPCLLELELIEPSLFFAYAPGSAAALAAATLNRLAPR